LYKRKKRTEAVVDPVLVDFVTNEIISTAKTAGVGTDRVGGYFDPVNHWMHVDLAERYNHRDAARGQVDDQMHTGVCVGMPQLDHGDVWATATGDIRYAVHGIRPVVYIRQVPVIVQVSLRKLSPTDPIYDLALPRTPAMAYAGRMEF